MSGKYALIIGNTEYIDPGLAQLTAPGKDAEDFARVLKDKEIGAFDNVKVIVNEPSASVIEAIDEFFDQKKPDDMLVLYFSGHGIRDEIGSLYLAFKNTIRSRLRSTAIKSDYIKEAMDQSRSKRQVLILDCCNSGAFPQGTKAELGGAMGMTQAFQGYGRFVLTASDATQFAWEGDKVIGQTDNSLFTHFLVKGLEGDADSDGDGRITVDELYDYAYDQISRVTPKQTPTKSASKQEGEIILRQITRIEDIKRISLSDELLEATEDSRTFVREGAIHQLEKLLKGKNLGLARSAREALERMEREDDSRRVSQAAAQVLETIRQAERAEEERRAREEAERIAAQKAEEERIALEKAEAERKAKETADRLLAEQKVEEELIAKTTIEAKHLAEDKQLTIEGEDEEKNIHLEVAQPESPSQTQINPSSDYAVYVIVNDGIPLYQSLPSSNNWSVWLEKGTKLFLTKKLEDELSIGKYGHYIEVADRQGNKGYVTATAVRTKPLPKENAALEQPVQQKPEDERKTEQAEMDGEYSIAQSNIHKQIVPNKAPFFFSWQGRVLLGVILGLFLGLLNSIFFSIYYENYFRYASELVQDTVASAVICGLAGLLTYPHKLSIVSIIIGFLGAGIIGYNVANNANTAASYLPFNFLAFGILLGVPIGALVSRILFTLKIIR